MNKVKIVGSGYYVPENSMNNDDLSKLVETSDEWITQMTGIKNRHIVNEEENSDLATMAVKALIEKYELDIDKVRYLIVATFTPDQLLPSTACKVQAKLGWNGLNISAFDLNAACSGFVFSLQVATTLLENDGDIAIVIGSEVISNAIDWTDRNTCILFGDGAGAIAIEKNKEGTSMIHYTQTSGDLEGNLHTIMKDKREVIEMKGSEVFKFAVNKMPIAIEKVLKKANISIEEIDYIIPHQANKRIIMNVLKKIGLKEQQMIVNVDQFGNTSAASIPIAFAQCVEQGLFKKGMKIIFVGFGAGFTYGATYIEIR